ncbi:hypothetical protein [Lysinibacillus sphaericus]|uniref:hypothetical protein n=1 Tax=Lysinibacillus sphaericus TaxID=1421 RepID=UPI0018CEC766|nr:hypothetical protein [Lysinibacillus sphaericus]
MSVATEPINETIEEYLITRTSEFMEKASTEGKQVSPEMIKFFMKQWVLDYKIMN